jgi:hypothetical protein
MNKMPTTRRDVASKHKDSACFSAYYHRKRSCARSISNSVARLTTALLGARNRHGYIVLLEQTFKAAVAFRLACIEVFARLNNTFVVGSLEGLTMPFTFDHCPLYEPSHIT